MTDEKEVNTTVRVKRSELIHQGADESAKKLAAVEPYTEKFTRISTIRSIGIVVFHVAISNDRSYLVIGENSKRSSLMIRNLSAATVWIGEEGVSAGINGNGWPLKEDDVIILDRSYGGIYAITEAGATAILAVLEE